MNAGTSIHDIWPPALVAILIALLIAKAIQSIFNQDTQAKGEASPRCVCGEFATEAASYLNWPRDTWDGARTLHAFPAKIRRVIDYNHPPTLCKYHARHADTLIDEWVFRTRFRYASLNADVASEAATFEQEGLLKQIADGLTENQKRAVRKTLPPVRTLIPQGKTGTDNGEG